MPGSRDISPRSSTVGPATIPRSSVFARSIRTQQVTHRSRVPAILSATDAAAVSALPLLPPGLGRRQAGIKRLLDVVGASVGLLVLAPFLIMTAVVIALVDGRPVLFRQDRAGLGGRPFQIVKFRTMHHGADDLRAQLRAFNEVNGSASFKMTNDPRITRLGRILRRTSIDELPQLWNVLRGEMSLVGPRPHPFDDVAGYAPWHHRRFAVKPGITGLWQISSRREADFDRWVALDLDYIVDWSLRRDVEILLGTIPAVLRADGR